MRLRRVQLLLRRPMAAACASVALTAQVAILLPPTPVVAVVAPPNLAILSTTTWTGAGPVPALHVVGEIQNQDLALTAGSIRVDCKLFDVNGATLAEEQLPGVDVTILQPTEKSPFEVMFISPPAFDHDACTVASVSTPQQPNHNFTFNNVAVAPLDLSNPNGAQVISGTVHNASQIAVQNVELALTLYDSAVSKNAIAQEQQLVGQGATIPAGGDAAFSITHYVPPTWAPDSTALALIAEAPTPGITLNPGAVALTQIRTRSIQAPSVTVTNTGTADLHLGALTLGGAHPGDWSETDTCQSQTLVPLGSCSIIATFTPTAVGDRSASLQIADDANNNPHTLTLTGTGIDPHATPPPSPFLFATTVVGHTTAPSDILFTNDGSGDLHVATAQLSGSNSGDFVMVADSCSGQTVANGTACKVTIKFAPSAAGPRAATLTLTDDALSSPQLVDLKGTGTTVPAPAVTFDSATLQYAFANQLVGTSSAPQTVVITNTGTAPLLVTGASSCFSNAVEFLSGGTGCLSDFALQPGKSQQVPVTFTPGATGSRSSTLRVVDNASDSPQTVNLFGTGTFGGQYHAVTPTRFIDTRTGVGPLQGGHTMRVPIRGVAPVPGLGVTAVVLNVTVTNPTAPSYLTVFPTGGTPPLASNLNFVAGLTIPNLVEVALGADGSVTIFNAAGSVDVIVDVQGYVTAPAASPGSEGFFNPAPPVRILDTRDGTGGVRGALAGGHTLMLQVSGRGPIPSTGAEAVVLNVTETNPTAPSYLTVFPTGAMLPLASNLNFIAGQTAPNRVIVRLGTGGAVTIYNAAGTVDVIADVAGWFTDASAGGIGSGFTGVTPTRILDTRLGAGKVAAGSPRLLLVAGLAGVPLMNAGNPPTAVVLNVTVTNPTAPGSYLTVWPDDVAQPVVSDLNFIANQTVPNLVVVKVGASGSIKIFNAAGACDVIVDVVGWYS